MGICHGERADATARRKQPENPHSQATRRSAVLSLRRTFSSPSLGSATIVASRLSRLDRRRIQARVQKEFDVNGDREVLSTEVGSILGGHRYTTMEEELETAIRKVESDGDGYISLCELTGLDVKGIDSDEVSENLKEACSRSLPTKCRDGYRDRLIGEEE
ncbi:hypothetical protein U1Q18_044688 [Sarracenia purpurea var. burkii]